MLSEKCTPGIGIGRGRGLIRGPSNSKSPGLDDKENHQKVIVDTIYSNGFEENASFDKRPPRVTYIPNDDMEEYRLHVASGSNFDKFENVKVKVTGENIPTKVDGLNDLNIPSFLQTNIEKLNFKTLMPVQKHSIPIIAAYRDLMACAETGSGKTAAFLIPLITAVFRLRDGPPSTRNSPHCIIMVPSRELCRQVFTDAVELCRSSSIKCAYGYGGVEMTTSLQRIVACDILCVTPGRLMQYVNSDLILLDRLSYLVLDEADKLLSIDHFYDAVRSVLSASRLVNKRSLQVSLFSATFPRSIQCLAQDLLIDYLFVAVGVVGAANNDITQTVLEVTSANKMETALAYIENHNLGKTLIFVQKKRLADFYGIRLIDLGLKTTTIHGDRAQEDRERALNDFKSGRVKVLVATDVASRGLDIPHVDTVINIDMPDDVNLYVHRIGRSGRCGNPGSAVTFFDVVSDYHQASRLLQILRGSGQSCPDFLTRLGSSLKPRDTYKSSLKDLRTSINRINDTRSGLAGHFMNMNEQSDDDMLE